MQQLLLVEFDLVLPRGVAKGGNLNDAVLLQIAPDQPILRGLHFIQSVMRTLQLIPVDLADRRPRRKLWLQVLRESHRLQAVQPFLPVAEVVAIKLEIQLNVAQSKDTDGTDVVEMRRSVQRSLQWDRDLLLHFLGGPRWVLRDDLHQRRRRIGIRLNIQIHKSNSTPHQQPHHPNDDQHAITQQRHDQRLHCSTSLRSNSDPVVTTVSPGSRPDRTSASFVPLSWTWTFRFSNLSFVFCTITNA